MSVKSKLFENNHSFLGSLPVFKCNNNNKDMKSNISFKHVWQRVNSDNSDNNAYINALIRRFESDPYLRKRE